jgi:hypothetical protein
VHFAGTFDKKKNEAEFRGPFVSFVRASADAVSTARAGTKRLAELLLEQRPKGAGQHWGEGHIWNGAISDDGATLTNPLVRFMSSDATPNQTRVLFELKELADKCATWDGHGAVHANVFGTGATRDEGPLHFDDYLNFMVVLLGKKTFILGHPDVMAPGSGEGRLNENLNWKPSDRLSNNADWAMVELQAGDGLFLPPGWWHYVITEENSLMANWWVEAPVQTETVPGSDDDDNNDGNGDGDFGNDDGNSDVDFEAPVQTETVPGSDDDDNNEGNGDGDFDNDDGNSDGDFDINDENSDSSNDDDRMAVGFGRSMARPIHRGLCDVGGGLKLTVTGSRGLLCDLVAPASEQCPSTRVFDAAFKYGSVDFGPGHLYRRSITISNATKLDERDRVWVADLTSLREGAPSTERVIIKKSRSEREFETERAVYVDYANGAASCTTLVIAVRICRVASASRTEITRYIITLKQDGSPVISEVARKKAVDKFNNDSNWNYHDNKPDNFVLVGKHPIILDFGDCTHDDDENCF